MDALAVLQALDRIDARGPTTIQYFRARGLLDLSPDPSLKWSSDCMFYQLQQRFKQKEFLTS